MPRATLAAVLAVVLSAGALRAGHAEEPTRLAIGPETMPPTGVDWYGIYVLEGGGKIGHARMSFARQGEGANAPWRSESRVELGMVVMGVSKSLTWTTFEEFDADPPHALRRARTATTTDGERKVVALVRGPAGYSAAITEAGETRTMDLPDLDYTLADATSSALFARSRPEAGTSVTVRSFDVEDLEADTETLTLVSAQPTVVAGVRLVVYEVASRSASDGSTAVERLDDRGRSLSVVIGRTLEARLEPEETAKRPGKSGDLFAMNMARIDRALGESEDVESMTLEVTGKEASRLPAGPRQSLARDPVTGAWLLRLGLGAGVESPASAEEVERNLRETPDYPIRHPQVVALCREAVGDAATPREKVRRLVAFVSDFLEDDYRADSQSVLHLLQRRRGDCTEHALLFAALARAAGVPAREVGGLVYMGDEFLAFGGHAWNEVVLDGRWVPVDATSGQEETDATHVATRRGPEGEEMALLGGVSFKVREIRRAK